MKQNRTYRVQRSILTICFFLVLLLCDVPALSAKSENVETVRKIGKAFSEVAADATPAVVWITTEQIITRQVPQGWPFGDDFNPFEDDLFDYFFRRRSPRQRQDREPKTREYRQRAQGSGFIVSADGYILTNNHVVAKADKITVKLTDDREFEAKVIGTDPESEVAVVKIEDEGNLPYIELGDSDALEVGEWVLAIGNPFGLSHTVTAGIVSAKQRGIGMTTYEDYIQTDAAINPGNSGGPLINLDGKVIGINTAIIGPGGNIGIGFAIPINMARNIYEQIIEGGTVVRGYLGVLPMDLTPEMAESMDIEDTQGVVISQVTEDSAADKAGVKVYDVVIEFDGKPVDKAASFRSQVAMLKPGTKVEMVVLRDGKKKKLTVELDERPSSLAKTKEDDQTVSEEQLGLTVETLTDEAAEQYGYEDKQGVLIQSVEPGSLASMAGLRPGMLIMEVNRTKVKNTKDYHEAVTEAIETGSVMLLLNNGRYDQILVLNVPKEDED